MKFAPGLIFYKKELQKNYDISDFPGEKYVFAEYVDGKAVWFVDDQKVCLDEFDSMFGFPWYFKEICKYEKQFSEGIQCTNLTNSSFYLDEKEMPTTDVEKDLLQEIDRLQQELSVQITCTENLLSSVKELHTQLEEYKNDNKKGRYVTEVF